MHTSDPTPHGGVSPASGPTRTVLLAWALGPWLDPDSVQRRHASQFLHHLGRFGYPFHAFLAAAWCASVVGPMATVEVVGVLVLGCLLLRLPFVHRGLYDAVRQPATMLLLTWAAWGWLLAWREGFSPQSIHEVSYQRWGYALVAIWAVMDRRRLLIGALCVGFALAQLAQLLEWLGHVLSVPSLVWSHPPAPDPASRVSGWWHQPAVGGSMLVAALGLHLGPAMLGRGQARVIAILASGATLLALLATGTRGAWIAAITLACIVGCGAIALRARGGWRAIAGAVLGFSVIVGAVLALDGPRARVASLASEVRDAWVRGDLDSDVGGRVLAARAAIDAAMSRPITGIGPGNFNASMRSYAQREGITVAPFRLDQVKTAHNTPLHVWATQGMVGVLLLYAAIACALCAGLRPDEPRTLREHLGNYDAAPTLALLGMVLAGAFDATPLNASTAALSTILIALCPAVKPRAACGSIWTLAPSGSR